MLRPVSVVVSEMSSMMVRMVMRGRTRQVVGDEAEHAVLDPVPPRGARRVVAHGDRQTGLARDGVCVMRAWDGRERGVRRRSEERRVGKECRARGLSYH